MSSLVVFNALAQTSSMTHRRAARPLAAERATPPTRTVPSGQPSRLDTAPEPAAPSADQSRTPAPYAAADPSPGRSPSTAHPAQPWPKSTPSPASTTSDPQRLPTGAHNTFAQCCDHPLRPPPICALVDLHIAGIRAAEAVSDPAECPLVMVPPKILDGATVLAVADLSGATAREDQSVLLRVTARPSISTSRPSSTKRLITSSVFGG